MCIDHACFHTLNRAGWVFPKYDHVAVGTGTVINKTSIKQYQQVRKMTEKGSVYKTFVWGSRRLPIEVQLTPEY